MWDIRFPFILAGAAFVFVASSSLAAEKTTAVWSNGRTASLSDEELIRNTLASPGIPYPDQARRVKLTGSGLYDLRINKTGAVTEVSVVKSSGSSVLDNAARGTFRKWRFKPAILTSVRIPVSWSANPVRD